MEKKKEASILIVDDAIENLKIMAKKLKEDYSVIITKSGEKAIEYLNDINKESPDLILLDVIMPEMGGYEVCKIIKENKKLENIPIIFITGNGDEENELKAMEVGAADFVTKPISTPILKARIKNQLRIVFQQRYLEKMVKERTQEIVNTQLAYMSKIGLKSKESDKVFIKHIKRVSHYSYLLCRKYGMEEKVCNTIFYARQIQGLGRSKSYDLVNNPENVINDEKVSPGRELFHEYSEKIMEVSKNIAVYENEKWNGKGYPNGLKRTAIPIEARISAISAYFDLWTMNRDKTKRVSFEEALEKLEKESGRSFDPVLVNLFLEEKEKVEKIMKIFNHEA